MTIQELADKAEVTTRTIRYYVEQGVLPPPERGRPAEYTDEHVERLALIKRLKEQYLPLEEIRDTMQRLSLAEVEQLVEQHSPPTQEVAREQKLESAADYIAGVFGRGVAREQLKRQAAPPVMADPDATQVPQPAPYYAPPAAPAPGAAPAMSPPQRSPVADRPSPQQATAETTATYIPPPAQLDEAESPSAAHGPPSTWERVHLGEGVELHYPAGTNARTGGKVARLIEAARRILGKDPGNGE